MTEIKQRFSGYFEAKGVELVELSINRHKARSILRFLVTRPEGITVEDCAQINREIGAALEADDLIQGSYILEVSSPGLDRPLVTTRDFERSLEKRLKIVLHQPLNKQNLFHGLLKEVNEQEITILTNEAKVILPRTNIAKATLEVQL